MSTKSEQLEGAGDEVCASCGVAGVDDTKLKNCACNLVKYCGVKCQKDHRPKHKKACKKKMAELRDRDLFTQSDESSFMGECPICCLPLSINENKSFFMTCCSKIICNGCCYANEKREFESRLEHRCAFCRNPAPKSQEESCRNVMKRIKKHNDPAAMAQMGKLRYNEKDYVRASEYFTKAVALGDVGSNFCLGTLYCYGDGVEKDEKRAIHHWEQAAIGGHPNARVFLANYEMENGRIERAAKHYIIAANLGCDYSLKSIKEFCVQGKVSKEDYAAALRAHQAAVGATKSAEREKAEAFREARRAARQS